MSSGLYSDLTVGLALKNYPKIPLDQKLWSTYRFITIYLLHSFQQYLAADLSAVKQDEIENLLLGILCLSTFGWLLLWLQLSFVYTQEKRPTNRFRYTSWERSTYFGSDSMLRRVAMKVQSTKDRQIFAILESLLRLKIAL